MSSALTLKDIQSARQRIAPCIRRTPLSPSATLSERLKTNVYVKLEMFQKTGSFKVRGAFNKALSLKPEEREHGIVAVSGGNHAQAVAYVARALGLRSLILMPESTPAQLRRGHARLRSGGQVRRLRRGRLFRSRRISSIRAGSTSIPLTTRW